MAHTPHEAAVSPVAGPSQFPTLYNDDYDNAISSENAANAVDATFLFNMDLNGPENEYELDPIQTQQISNPHSGQPDNQPNTMTQAPQGPQAPFNVKNIPLQQKDAFPEI